MDRREYLAVTGGMIAIAGCSGSSDEEQSSNNISENESSNDANGLRGPEEAVEHYNDAIELLEKNSDEFEEVRQQLITDQEPPDFSATTIASRTSEIRSKLGRAKEYDDGSLSDAIEALRKMSSYQDKLAEYNEEYLKLVGLINNGMNEYRAGEHQSAIGVFENAQQQIEPTNSVFDSVVIELEAVQDTAEQAQMNDELIQEITMVEEDHDEIQTELTILSDLLPARIDEIRGDSLFIQGDESFENENYSDARSHYSDAESHFIAAKTRLESISVEEVTVYIQRLINDIEGLICDYEFSAAASDDLQKAANAMENGNFDEAEEHWENANSNLSSMDMC
ncbi:hypothetical protein JCM17823_24280 [Halorubrum gandharaense]